MTNQEILKNYYNHVCSPLVFINEKMLENNTTAKMYLYDFTTEQELKNFKKIFQEYLIFYIKNYDTIDNLKIPENNNIIANYLVEKSKKIRKNIILPQRATKINGLYGELFNDFYLRNVCQNERFIAYISKRTYESGNNENKGIDNVTCSLVGNSLEIVLSEAKFLKTTSAVSTGLISDTEHVDLDYINTYMNIVLQKQAELNPERNLEINNKINSINDLVEDEDKSFIEAINILGYSIRFVFFAIFKNEERDVLKYETRINNIINSFNEKIGATGILNYNIEIVFIPTFNSSMDLKNVMEAWT
ncbi:MAG: hypothetical protein PHG03_05170 [Bacilli bacterium]|nr:hypothetical protein [Bacilli bacterium]MDD4795925.1 hypothetical protein [Bacilli bacterium]